MVRSTGRGRVGRGYSKADTLPSGPRLWFPARTGKEGKAAKLRPPRPPQIGIVRIDDQRDRPPIAPHGPRYLGHRG